VAKKIGLVSALSHNNEPATGDAGSGAAPRCAQILRNSLKCNFVRTSHNPQSRHFLDACDEFGLLLEEITGWQHIGDEA
jgi:beta-galactosidase